MVAKTNLRDSYKHYKNKVENPVDVRIYLYIVTGFIAFIMRKVFDGYDVELSSGRTLGTVGVRAKKQKLILDEEGNIVGGASVNWKETNKYWAENPEAKAKRDRIFYLNEHTGGLTVNLRWWSGGSTVTNKRLYFLLFCKPNRRKVSALFSAGKEYLVK